MGTRPRASGGSGADFAWAVKVGPDDNQYVTGQFSLNRDSSRHTTLVSAGGTDIFSGQVRPFRGAALGRPRQGGPA